MSVDIAIVGAQKAGTTSLKEYLAQHPDIHTHPQVEFAFFRDDELYKGGFEAAKKKFLTVNKELYTGKTLIKNVGIYSSKVAVERLYQHNPNCKILFLVRNPTLRAFSSFSMEKFNGWYKEYFHSIKNAIENEDFENVAFKLFIGHGLYVNHLKLLYSFFDRAQIRIIEYDTFLKEKEAVCMSIIKWIGLDDSFKFEVSKVFNETKKSNSTFLSSILIRLRNNKNFLKRFVKFILPYGWFTKLGAMLIGLNKSKQRLAPMSNDMKEYLKVYFDPYNKEFDRMAGTNFAKKWRKL